MADNIKEVKAYMTTDGKLHISKIEAEITQLRIELDTRLDILIQRECYSNMNPRDVKIFIIDNRLELYKIFLNCIKGELDNG